MERGGDSCSCGRPRIHTHNARNFVVITERITGPFGPCAADRRLDFAARMSCAGGSSVHYSSSIHIGAFSTLRIQSASKFLVKHQFLRALSLLLSTTLPFVVYQPLQPCAVWQSRSFLASPPDVRFDVHMSSYIGE